jgi:hypothetical protein
MKITKQEKAEALEMLKHYIKPSSKINIVITSVARSGMSRRMKVYSHNMDLNFTYNIAIVLELPLSDEGVRVGGAGMDMTFWLANALTHALGYSKRKTLRGNGGSCIDWKAIY